MSSARWTAVPRQRSRWSRPPAACAGRPCRSVPRPWPEPWQPWVRWCCGFPPWLKQCHKPINHPPVITMFNHFYGWYNNYSPTGIVYYCFNHITFVGFICLVLLSGFQWLILIFITHILIILFICFMLFFPNLRQLQGIWQSCWVFVAFKHHARARFQI